MYTRSPAACEALKGFNVLKLPSVSSLKAFTGSNLEAPGDIQKRLSESYTDYQAMIEQKKAQGLKTPLGEGVVIFDEVKVASNVSFQDVYQSLDPDAKTQTTSYVQTLWRDLTSEFDIIGPYYTSADGLKSCFLLPCIMDTIYQFNLFGFKTFMIIWDGASPNLTMLKLLCGRSGAYIHDKYKVPVSFTNPFTGQKIFQLICPSHQVCTAFLCT